MVEFKGMRIRKTRLNLSILILGLVIICLLFGIFAKKEHYITFYDGNTSITARSDARTVGEALARANIKLGEYDTVEPDLEEKISEEDFYINIYRAREVLVVDGYVKKYIKTAGDILWKGCLIALDAVLHVRKGKGRPSIKKYKEAASKRDGKLIRLLSFGYDTMHLVMGYDGNKDKKVCDAGFDSANAIIDRCAILMPEKASA